MRRRRLRPRLRSNLEASEAECKTPTVSDLRIRTLRLGIRVLRPVVIRARSFLSRRKRIAGFAQRLLRRFPRLQDALLELVRGDPRGRYEMWVVAYDTLDDADLAPMGEEQLGFPEPPLLSLVVPIAHVDTIEDLPAELTAPVFNVVRRMSAAVQRALGADGSFVAVNTRVSQSVPHLHVHVVPRARNDGLFSPRPIWKRRAYAGEQEAAEYAEKIRIAYAVAATDR
jgi:histidine triad (HIT) family protein